MLPISIVHVRHVLASSLSKQPDFVAQQVESKKRRLPCNQTSVAHELANVSITGTAQSKLLEKCNVRKSHCQFHSDRRRSCKPARIGRPRSTAHECGGKRRYRCSQGEVLRRRPEGAERL